MPLSESIKKALRFGRRSVHPLITANNQHFKGADYPQLLSDCEFVVFDTELTGFNNKHDEIIAIGAVRIRNLRIVCGETFYALVRPDVRFQTKSTLVHRLTPQELHGASPMVEVLPRFLDFCGNAFLVGHFVRLDLEFINRSTHKLMGGVLHTPYLDTMCLAMAYNDLEHGSYCDHYNRPGAYTLAALSKEYGLPSFVEHNALQDSLQTAYLFLYLVKKIQRHGVRTMNEYLAVGRNRSMLWWPF